MGSLMSPTTEKSRIQAQIKRAVARYLRSQWISIRKDQDQFAGRPNEFLARKQIVLHALAGVRLFVLHLWGYYTLNSDCTNRIVDAIDRTSKRIKLLRPRPARPIVIILDQVSLPVGR
jgi:hypothetical protein